MLAPLIVSHAACKGHAPENTLAGVRAAMALGVDAIEIDVHASRDGVPVLLHDPTLDRTTDGTGRVESLTLAEIRAVEAGGAAFEGRFRGERIPTLAEVVDLARESGLLVIEIKQRGIEPAVLDVVRRANAAVRTMIWSFHPEVVSAARTLAPEVPAAQLAFQLPDGPAALMRGAVRRNAQAVSVYAPFVDAALIRAARLHGLGVFAWTVDAPEEQARVAALGVGGIVTNVPDVLRSTLRRSRYTGMSGAPSARPRRKRGGAHGEA
jgi:glycerophosphoryl diester phosphodiesterase